jgi:hypothetical protein
MTAKSTVNDVEEAKIGAEYVNEPTDERNDDPTVTTPITGGDVVTLQDTRADNMDSDNDPTTTNDNNPIEETTTVKQIKMKVAADAPWIDRIWEGMYSTVVHFILLQYAKTIPWDTFGF